MKQLIATLLLLAAVGSTACIQSPGTRRDRDDDSSDGPADVGDGSLVVGADGIARGELWLDGLTTPIRTLGVAVRVEGGDVLEFERDDALFVQNGGRVIPLETRVVDGVFRMTVGTTAPAAIIGGADGVRLASLTVRARAGETPRLVVVDDPGLGIVDAAGARFDGVRDGNFFVRSVTGGVQ